MNIEHHIQRQIVERLARSESLRFAELKPAGMESNVFTYHLRQLLAQKIVQKTDSGYRLAHKGLQYVDGISFSDLKIRQQPKLISIIALQCADHGKYLMAERLVQPYISQYMFPSGKLHMGETAQAHVSRELFEKTGLTADLRLRGVANIRIDDQAELLTQVVGYVFSGTVDECRDLGATERFAYHWTDPQSGEEVLMPATKELVELITGTDDLFITDISASL